VTYDWIQNLNFELERRDKRHAFLWTALVSGLTAVVYLGSHILWNPPAESGHWWAAVGIGAALFSFWASRIAGHLWKQLHPAQTNAPFTVSHAVLIVRHMKAYGFRDSVLIECAEIVAYILGGVAFTFIGLGTLGVVRWIEFAFAIWFFFEAVQRMLIPFIPRGFLVAIMAATLEGIIANAENWQVLKKSALVKELHREAVILGTNVPIRTKRMFGRIATGFLGGPSRLRSLMIPVAFVLLLWTARNVWLPTPFARAAEFASAAAVTLTIVVGLVVLKLAALLYFNNSRRMLEQLRFAILVGACEPQFAGYLYSVIDFLDDATFPVRENLSDMAVKLGLRDLFNYDVEFANAQANNRGKESGQASEA
jgi:hypothetical protein